MTNPVTGSEQVSISAEDLAATYGGPTVLRDVNFRVEPGSTVGVIGPNGCGKTTLFKVLLGSLDTLNGSFSTQGRIAYVPQHDRSRHDFPVNALDVALMGCYESVPWWRTLRGRPRQIAQRALERVGLGDFAADRYGTLSGGQRQRALIARALAQEADILFLDEPFSNVDPASVETILELIDQLKHEGRTIMITTHDVEQARTWDLVLCLNVKQIAFGEPNRVMTPESLKETYGRELIVIDKETGQQAVSVQHHDHD